MRADALENAVQNVIKEGKLTPKVVIPVDLFGLPADYMSIKDVAEKYNLFVLEDAAQGFGYQMIKMQLKLKHLLHRVLQFLCHTQYELSLKMQLYI